MMIYDWNEKVLNLILFNTISQSITQLTTSDQYIKMYTEN